MLPLNLQSVYISQVPGKGSASVLGFPRETEPAGVFGGVCVCVCVEKLVDWLIDFNELAHWIMEAGVLNLQGRQAGDLSKS